MHFTGKMNFSITWKVYKKDYSTCIYILNTYLNIIEHNGIIEHTLTNTEYNYGGQYYTN